MGVLAEGWEKLKKESDGEVGSDMVSGLFETVYENDPLVRSLWADAYGSADTRGVDDRGKLTGFLLAAVVLMAVRHENVMENLAKACEEDGSG